MKILRWYPKNRLYLCLIFITTAVFYVEFVSYYLNSFNWYSLKCQDERRCTKILLVADPQLIGNNEENIHFLTPLTITDSDSYLRKTYSRALDFVKPDVVVFLGDLMDEAHKATNEEFHQYVRRLFNIYLDRENPSSIRHIWLPGDNDIGGEDTMITKEKVDRFQHAFSQPSLISVKNITFFKINRLISDIPVYKTKREFYDADKIFVGLSHMPMMFIPSSFVDRVFEKMKPHVLFTAHEHKSMVISTNAMLKHDFHIVPLTSENNQVLEFSLAMTDMYEIMIPTCSYRMGTDNIGYGYAVIEDNYLRFTVLWSPSRFFQLRFYGFSVCVIFFLLTLRYFVRCFHKICRIRQMKSSFVSL